MRSAIFPIYLWMGAEAYSIQYIQGKSLLVPFVVLQSAVLALGPLLPFSVVLLLAKTGKTNTYPKAYKEDKTVFEIKEVSNVDATANAFGMWASGVVSVGACVAGAKLLILALAC